MKKSRCCAGMLVGLFTAVPLVWGQGFPSEKSRVEYSHVSARGNPCRFEIGVKGGEADYYWNGARQRDKLEPSGRQEKGKGNIFNVYKVVGKDLWFFFAVNEVERQGTKDYPMRYSKRGPELEGSVAIETRGPTKVRTFEIKD
jgi:hypothetical protein